MSRICIIRHYYYPEDPRSRREAEALVEAGHEVDLLALRQAGEPAREVINGVNVRRLPVGHYRGSLLLYAYEYSAFFVLAFLVLAGRMVVPELAQGEVTPERLGRELERWLDEPEAVRQLENLFTAIHRQLRLGASGKAAAAILDLARREAP